MAISKTTRKQVFDVYGGRCAYCGCELSKGWHVDHIEAVVRRKKRIDGKLVDAGFERPENDCVENMAPSCPPCNIQKHGQTVEVFRSQIAAFINSLNQYHSIYRFAKRYGLIEETNKPVVFYFETIAANESTL